MGIRIESPALMPIHPGSILKEELKERGISQKMFARMADIQESHLSEAIKGKRSITKSMADRFETVLGIPSIDWLNLQAQYDYDTRQNEALVTQEAESYAIYTEYNKYVDVRTLMSRLCFNSRFYSEIVSFLRDNLRLDEPEKLQLQFSGLFKKSPKVGKDPRKTLTWMVLARHYAVDRMVKQPYEENKLTVLTEEVSSILHRNRNTINGLIDVFEKYGILFGVVEKIDGASIDGYSFELNGHPCIIVTQRYDRIDNLAFAVMHELGHIVGHDSETARINLNEYDHESAEEKAANRFAANALIPDTKWQELPKVHLTPASIQRCCSIWAEANGYNKWIALGRLSHETGMYKFKNDSSRKISK